MNEGKTLCIIETTPIARGLFTDTLSFFTSESVSIGDVISVPIRNKKTLVTVLTIRSVSDAKTELKKASFSLKKASNITPVPLFTPEILKASTKIAEYVVSSVGTILYAITPTSILDDIYAQAITPSLNISKHKAHHDVYVIQSSDSERFSEYKSIIREEFARTSSVFFCVPTKEDALAMEGKLHKGIENYTYVIHSGLSKKAQLDIWNKILQDTHPVLIIATGGFLSIPRIDIGSIIIEKESSSAYKMIQRPFVDIRTSARIIAEHTGARLIYGDSLLRIETIWKQKEGYYVELQPLKFRQLSTAKEKLIPIDTGSTEDAKKFQVLSDPIRRLIRHNKERSQHLCILTNRKGIAPTTVCADCGKTVTCQNCSGAVTLHKKSNGNFYLCHRCGTRRDADIHCSVCDGWRLVMLGIGTETIEKEIQEILPDIKTLILDKEHVRTPKQIHALIEEFYNSPGSVLIGTEMALRYLREPIGNIAIASIDSLFGLPDFRIYEKILHIIIAAREHTEHNLLIQTRNQDTHIFEYGLGGNMLDFYKENIQDRKILFYPPFSLLIRISITGAKKDIVKQMEHIQQHIGPHKIDIFPAFIAQKNKKTSIHALIRLERSNWPNPELIDLFRSLARNVSIDVEPESIL